MLLQRNQIFSNGVAVQRILMSPLETKMEQNVCIYSWVSMFHSKGRPRGMYSWVYSSKCIATRMVLIQLKQAPTNSRQASLPSKLTRKRYWALWKVKLSHMCALMSRQSCHSMYRKGREGECKATRPEPIQWTWCSNAFLSLVKLVESQYGIVLKSVSWCLNLREPVS